MHSFIHRLRRVYLHARLRSQLDRGSEDEGDELNATGLNDDVAADVSTLETNGVVRGEGESKTALYSRLTREYATTAMNAVSATIESEVRACVVCVCVCVCVCVWLDECSGLLVSGCVHMGGR
jgi:hypothetical protein